MRSVILLFSVRGIKSTKRSQSVCATARRIRGDTGIFRNARTRTPAFFGAQASLTTVSLSSAASWKCRKSILGKLSFGRAAHQTHETYSNDSARKDPMKHLGRPPNVTLENKIPDLTIGTVHRYEVRSIRNHRYVHSCVKACYLKPNAVVSHASHWRYTTQCSHVGWYRRHSESVDPHRENHPWSASTAHSRRRRVQIEVHSEAVR